MFLFNHNFDCRWIGGPITIRMMRRGRDWSRYGQALLISHNPRHHGPCSAAAAGLELNLDPPRLSVPSLLLVDAVRLSSWTAVAKWARGVGVRGPRCVVDRRQPVSVSRSTYRNTVMYGEHVLATICRARVRGRSIRMRNRFAAPPCCWNGGSSFHRQTYPSGPGRPVYLTPEWQTRQYPAAGWTVVERQRTTHGDRPGVLVVEFLLPYAHCRRSC